MPDLVDFSEQRKVSICCGRCGECYYIEAVEKGSLEGWKFCVLCYSNIWTVLDENLHPYYTHRNGDLIEISCGECSPEVLFQQ